MNVNVTVDTPFQESLPKKRGRKPKNAPTLISPSKKTGKLNLFLVQDDNVSVPVIPTDPEDDMCKNGQSTKEFEKVVKDVRIDSPLSLFAKLYIDPVEVNFKNLNHYEDSKGGFFDNSSGYFQILQDFVPGYPSKTDVCCWWCCHTFDNHPIGIPVNHDEKKNIFKVIGCFCTFSCALAYLETDANLKTRFPVQKFELLHLYNQLIGTTERIDRELLKPAPDRITLKAFGGHLSIEEFRSIAPLGMKFVKTYAPMMPWGMYMEEVTNVHKSFGKKPLEIRKAVKKTVAVSPVYETVDKQNISMSASTAMKKYEREMENQRTNVDQLISIG